MFGCGRVARADAQTVDDAGACKKLRPLFRIGGFDLPQLLKKHEHLHAIGTDGGQGAKHGGQAAKISRFVYQHHHARQRSAARRVVEKGFDGEVQKHAQIFGLLVELRDRHDEIDRDQFVVHGSEIDRAAIRHVVAEAVIIQKIRVF